MRKRKPRVYHAPKFYQDYEHRFIGAIPAEVALCDMNIMGSSVRTGPQYMSVLTGSQEITCRRCRALLRKARVKIDTWRDYAE
jgi:hypothetical protein